MDAARSGLWSQIVDALFRDLPRELDRLFRELEFKVNRLYTLPPSVESLDDFSPKQRGKRQLHPVLLLGIAAAALLLFGPTFGSVCTAIGRRTALGLVWLALVIAILMTATSARRIKHWWVEALELADIPAVYRVRRALFRLGLFTGAVLPVLLVVFTTLAVLENFSLHDDGLCVEVGSQRLAASLQLATFLALALLMVFARRFGDEPLQQSDIRRVFGWFTIAGAVQLALAWFLVGNDNREALHAPYLHVFTVAVVGLMLIAVLAHYFARKLFRPIRENRDIDFLRATLRNTELFQSRKDQVSDDAHIVHAFLSGLFGNIAFTLLPASLPTLIAAPDWVERVFLTGLVLSLLFNTWSRLNQRWNAMFNMIRRWFFVGWPTAISYLVIVIGVTRFAGVGYVTTVVDGAPLGFLPTLIILGYSTLWFFEYWINRPLTTQYLELLGAPCGEDSMVYACNAELQLTSVARQPRWLQIHGPGRLAVLGYYKRAGKFWLAWHSYSHSEFLDRLKARGHDIDRGQTRESESADNLLEDIRRRTALYFNSINFCIAALIGVSVWMGVSANNKLERQPLVMAEQLLVDDTRGYSLSRTLQDKCGAGNGECGNVVLVAASGGGSRAALHTVAVLRGLAREKRLADVAVVSGVSGGGASLAYFAAHHKSLMAGFPSADWACFADAMSSSFIQQVIESSGELRMVRHKTLAHSLAESLADKFYQPVCSNERRTSVPATRQVIEVSDLGILLNTTVTGHPANRAQVSNRLYPDATRPSTEYAGARLVFTNLLELSAFPSFSGEEDPRFDAYPGAPGMPYVMVRADNVSLAQAAALNANFPPVFANSEVRLRVARGSDEEVERYFVTDGGVAENRGVLSLILALQSAIAELEITGRVPERHYPDIDIVIADAGSLGYQYSADRGIGTAVSGGPQLLLASAWYRSIYENTKHRYEALTGASISMHIRPMPLVLRLNGAIGTHWMLPTNIVLQDPQTTLGDDGPSYKIDRQQAKCIILGTFEPSIEQCLEGFSVEAAADIRSWLRIGRVTR